MISGLPPRHGAGSIPRELARGQQPRRVHMTTSPDNSSSPTVLLVHGAFADSAGWNGVLTHLHDRGVSAWAVSNPLRGITHDAAYVSSIIQQTEGPVLAVGHSYGGEMRRASGRE